MVHDIQLSIIQKEDPIPKSHAAQNSITLYSKKETLNEVIARLAAEDVFSYSKICQSEFIRSALRDKGFTPIRDRKTVYLIVIRYAKMVKEKMTSQLQTLLLNDKRLSVTLDEYTSIQNKRYMNVNVHIANKFWNLEMARIYGRMPAEKVLENLIEKLEQFKIDLHQHIVSIVCDGAPIMVKMGKLSCIHQQTYLVHGVHLALVAVLYSKSRTPISIQGINENVSDESEDDSMASNLLIVLDSVDDDVTRTL